MYLFVLGTVFGMGLILGIRSLVILREMRKEKREVAFNQAVNAKVAELRSPAPWDREDPWNDEGWRGPKPGAFVPVRHP